MNYTKTKTFIAFINKEKKDTYWINGNYCFDEDVPKIYPYESKEEKKDAIDIGKRLGVWDETSDIDAILFKVVGEPFSVITKREAAEYEKILSAEAAQRVAERKAKELEEKTQAKEAKKKTKEEVDEIVEPLPILPKVVEKIEVEKEEPKKVEVKMDEPKEVKRGRPKRSIFED